MLSFCANWRKTDALARSHFGVAEDDPRRLQAAVEEACYRTFSAGHTSVLSAKLMDTLQGILGAQTKTFKWRSLVPTALSQGLSNGSFVIGDHGVQPLGAMVMEREVAEAVAARLASQVPALLPEDDIDDSGYCIRVKGRRGTPAFMAPELMLIKDPNANLKHREVLEYI